MDIQYFSVRRKKFLLDNVIFFYIKKVKEKDREN